MNIDTLGIGKKGIPWLGYDFQRFQRFASWLPTGWAEGYGPCMSDSMWRKSIVYALIQSCRDGGIHIRVGGAPYTELVRRGKYNYYPNDLRCASFWTDIEAGHPRYHECKRLKLMAMPQGMGSSDVLKKLRSQGFRAATLPELLVFGARTASILFDWEIVALGTLYHRQPRCPQVLALCSRNVRANRNGWRGLEWRSWRKHWSPQKALFAATALDTP